MATWWNPFFGREFGDRPMYRGFPREELDAAIGALRVALPASRLLARNFHETRIDEYGEEHRRAHPLASYAITDGRYSQLLEAGLALSRLGPGLQRAFGDRLLDEAHRADPMKPRWTWDPQAAMAELHTLSLLWSLGAREPRYEPLRGIKDARGEQIKGPDWAFRCGSSGLRLAVETKSPPMSEAEKLRRRSQFRGIWAMQMLAPTATERCRVVLHAESFRGIFHPQQYEERILNAIAADESDPARALDVGGIGRVEPALGSMMVTGGGDALALDHEAERMRDLVDEARGQLRSFHEQEPNSVGLIVIDTDNDDLAAEHCCAAAKAMCADDPIGAVLLLKHEMPGYSVRVVMGPRYLDLPEEILRGLDMRWCGHVHLSAFTLPTGFCDPRFQRPPLCTTAFEKFFVESGAAAG